MAEKATKILILFFLIFFLAIQPSCRVFKKDLESEYQKSESNSILVDNSKITENKNLDSDLFETREINVKFSNSNPKPRRNELDLSLDTDFEIDIPDAAIDRLVERISELSIKVETRKTEHEESSKIQENDLKETIAKEEELKTKNVVKESDSTIGANIPWYAWIIGAILIFGIVWYLVKQVKPV